MSTSSETFGSAIQAYAVDQLKARAALVESNSKTKEQLIAINSNTAWVMLRSSVNQITDAEVKSLLKDRVNRPNVTGLADLAKKYVLTGGTITAGGKPRAGVNFDPGSTEGEFAYQNLGNGFRAMPGITGLKVKTKNRFGTILQADIDFVIWSMEDLENIEKLFFKPGYTCILEWGHSTYVDNSGNTQAMGTNNFTVPNATHFTPQDAVTMDNNIIAKKEAGSGNYDGMYGYIQNYSWSFRPDGGYDCSVKMVSRGQIIEAMKVAKTTDKTQAEESDEDKDKIESKSILHYTLSKLTDNDSKKMDGKKLLSGKKASKVANLMKHDFNVHYTDMDVARTGAFSFFEKGIDLCYIKLRTFLDIINATSVLTDTTKDKKLIEFNLDKGQEYTTYPNHWSIDPIMVQLPKIPSKDTDYCVQRDGLTKQMMEDVDATERNDVLNIFLSTHYLMGVIDKVLGKAGEDEGAGLHDVLMSVMQEMQRCLGNINQFDLYSDPERGNMFAVVDRNNLKTDSIPMIDLTGLKSTTKSINITSKISSKISNMVAIAAQGNSGNYNENIQTLLQWNQGSLDRHIRVKDGSDAKQDQEAIDRIEKHKEELSDTFDQFNATASNIFTNKLYDGEKFSQMENQNASYTQQQYRAYIYEKGLVPQGVIPIELSLKMLGISGLKPGTSFRINPGILPPKYEGYGFIITGVSHTIENNQWYTDLKTTFFPINPVPKVTIASTSGASGNGSGTPAAGQQQSVPPTPQEIEGHTHANRLRAAINEAGFVEKGQELSNGGDITKQTADLGISFVKKCKQEVPQVQLRFTGGNDAFHHTLSYNSRHKSGRGLDFTIIPYSSANQKAVLKVLQGFAAGNVPNVKFIDEYSNPTRKASGKHFHFSWGPGTEGKKDVNRAIALAAKGEIKKYTV
jgi:hypothetical protein